MMKLFKPKRANSILGLSLDGNRLEAVVVRRGNNGLQVQQALAIPLALSPLSGDPELVGREIRNHLNAAGIKERRCAVCLPLNWVLTVQTTIPEMPESDIASFLEIEAERGFHSGAENLSVASSRAKAANGEQAATLLGIPRNHLLTLEKALKAAQLKPLTFSLGIAALAAGKAAPAGGVLTLALSHHGIDLEISSGGGIVALRSLDAALEAEGNSRSVDAELVARELRITFGQLSPGFSGGIATARIFGRGEPARQFGVDISRRLEKMGIKAEIMERASDAPFNPPPAPEVAISPALALAAGYLRGQMPPFEFLPPKIRPWQNLLSTKFSSKRLAYAGGALGALLLLAIGAFGFQQWELAHLNAQWSALDPQVADLVKSQDQIRRFRPWYDTSFRGLRILRSLTEAFPEEGSVSAKNIDIRDLSSVTCSGVARDNQSYLGLIDKLNRRSEVSGLKTEMVRGQSPVQFTLNFQWEGSPAGGN